MTAPPLRTAARPDMRLGRRMRLRGGRLWVQHAPLLAISVSVLLWASAFVGIRAAGQSLAPGPLSLGRLVVALFALLVVMLIRREPLPTRRALLDAGPALLVCGVVWFGVYNLALNAAERHVDAGTAAMIVYISPVLIALLAGSVLGEGYSRPLFVGCAVSFVGVSVIGAASASHRATTQGVALCLIAAVSLALGAVSQKIVLRHLSGLQTIFLCCAIGVAILLPFAESLVREMQTASMSALVWTVYLGIFPTAIGFLTWAFALSRSEAGPLGVTTYLVPAVSVILAWLVLAETPRPIALLGGVLCLVGVAISRESRVRRPRTDEGPDIIATPRGRAPAIEEP